MLPPLVTQSLPTGLCSNLSISESAARTSAVPEHSHAKVRIATTTTCARRCTAFPLLNELHPPVNFPRSDPVSFLSPRRPGGQGRVRGADGLSRGTAHLTLPSLCDRPLPLPPEGRRGAIALGDDNARVIRRRPGRTSTGAACRCNSSCRVCRK